MNPATVVSDPINLSRSVLNYGSPGVNNTHIADSVKRLEDHAASAVEHIPQLDVLDTKNSDTVTETAVQVANAISRSLDDVVRMKSTFKQRQYDHTIPKSVRRINESYQHVDQEFDKAIKDFQ